MPPLPADVTLALGALKPAHVLLPTAPACGRVLLAPIGISANKVKRTLPRTREAKPEAAAHKFTRGMVLVFAGPMRGAAGLTAAAALRAGAGYVVLDGSERRSEEHTSELQSLMRIPYAVFCLKKKKTYHT